MKKNGFTLVELLATLTILSIIMAIAIPNVMSIIDKNKRTTYIEDAKKLATQADYKFRMSQNIERPSGQECVVFKMSTLDVSELKKGPEGTPYNTSKSFVAVKYVDGTYKYIVTLFEDKNRRGIEYTESSRLTEEGAMMKYVKEDVVDINLSVGSTIYSAYGLPCRVKSVN